MIEESIMSEKSNQSIGQPADNMLDHLESVESWGGAGSSVSYVYRPSNEDQLQEVLLLAKQSGRSVGLRGGGNSYGDAAMNSENILLDMRRMNRIRAWNPEDWPHRC